MTTLNIEIPAQLNNALLLVAKELHQWESDIVIKAIESYLQELQEDNLESEMSIDKVLTFYSLHNSLGEWESKEDE